MDIRIFSTANELSAFTAQEIIELVRARKSSNRTCVLGLAAGATPVAVYQNLVRLHRQGQSFANVVTFNLDEFYPMPPNSPHSFSRFMRENFLNLVDLDPANIHEFDGSLRNHGVAEFCERYGRAIAGAGGIDLQLLGIGRNGHIGFNEPGAARTSRTRLVNLDTVTRRDARDSFGADEVPHQAITMGIGSILSARRILLLAVGRHKTAILAKALDGAVTDKVPASFLQKHPCASAYLDRTAAERLARVNQSL